MCARLFISLCPAASTPALAACTHWSTFSAARALCRPSVYERSCGETTPVPPSEGPGSPIFLSGTPPLAHTAPPIPRHPFPDRRAVPTAADSLSPPAAAALYDRALSLAIRGSSVPPPPALSSLASGTTLSRGSVSPAAVDMLMRAVTSGALPRVPPASPGLWHSCLTLGSSSPSAGESPGTLAELLCDGDAYPFGSALGARCGDGAAGTRGYAEGSKEGESSSCWRAIFAALASSSAKRSDLTQGLISAASGAGVEAAHASMALAFLVWMRFAGADTLAAVAGARIRDPDPESAACLPWLGLAAVGLPVASQQSVLGEVAGLLKSAKGAARGACLAVMGSIAACALGEALLSAIEGHATHGGADGISMLPEVLPELVRTPGESSSRTPGSSRR